MRQRRWVLVCVPAAMLASGITLWLYLRKPEPRLNMQPDSIMSGQHRAELKRRYGKLFNEVAAAIFEADPIGINFGNNTDEYEPETATIVPRLRECRSEDDVCRITHEEFVRWFGPETAGPPQRYAKVA